MGKYRYFDFLTLILSDAKYHYLLCYLLLRYYFTVIIEKLKKKKTNNNDILCVWFYLKFYYLNSCKIIKIMIITET